MDLLGNPLRSISVLLGMIVPKDATLLVDITPDAATFSWGPPKGDKWAYGAAFWMFGVMFALAYFLPVDRPVVGMLIFSLVMLALGTAMFWLGSITRTTILATKTGIEVRRVPFSRWRSKSFATSPIQFYVTSGGGSQSNLRYGQSLCMIAEDGISHILALSVNPTMASQLWYELQEFYGLEDIEVLGEVSHQQHSESRRASRVE